MGLPDLYEDPYTDAMVDIETTGLRSDRHSMIQLALVPFNLEKGTIAEDYCFDKALRPLPSRDWQESTRNWWYGKNRVVLEEIMGRMEDPRQVMQQFNEFCNYFLVKGCRFWMKRPFDWAFIESYCHDLAIPNFFHYRDVIEATSFMKGMAFPDEDTEGLHLPNFGEHMPQLEGMAHNAQYDCEVQIHKILALSKHYGVIDDGV